jgi:hypothetical protein
VVMLLGIVSFITVISVWDFLESFVDTRLFFIYVTSFLFYNYYSVHKSS